jgi:hypothetical protein
MIAPISTIPPTTPPAIGPALEDEVEELVAEAAIEPDGEIEAVTPDAVIVGVLAFVGTKILMYQTHSATLGELLEPSALVRGICTNVHCNPLVGPTLQLVPIMTGFGGLLG